MSNAAEPRALVIDDEPSVRQVLRDFLSFLAIEADEAPSGAEGLARLADARYELVLTDLIMPGMTGMEVAEAVRVKHPAIAVVVVTGSAMPNVVDGIHQKGFHVLGKPFTLDAFKTTIERALATVANSSA
jgi:CheY-like chemotaxis protein